MDDLKRAFGEYKERNLAQLAELVLRDAAILGSGCIKVYQDDNERVALDRVMLAELFVDTNEELEDKSEDSE